MNLLKIATNIIPEIDQRWGDIWYRDGYYIQRNVVTCLQEGNRLAATNKSKHAVVILHGIARTKQCMRHIEVALQKEDFLPVNVSYPSLFRSLADHGNQINEIIGTLDVDTVSFIGYSLGGLVVRQTLSDDVKYNVGRIVQIGTPNQGATMADVCKDMYSFKYIAGDCGQTLRTDEAIKIKPLTGEFGIIAGGTGLSFGYNPILRGDNDGLVKVSETHMDGYSDFLLVKSDHHFLIQKEETVNATVNFLKNGKFS